MIFEVFYVIIYDNKRFLYDYIRFFEAFWRNIVITRCSWQLRAHTLHTKVLRHAEIAFNYFISPEAPHHIYQNDMF